MYLQSLKSGKKPQKSDLIYPDKLITQYYSQIPYENKKLKNIKFGTSGYRGTSKKFTFNEIHVLAISQAIVEERKLLGIHGPCFIGKDTHALSEPAFCSVLEVLTANNIDVIIQSNNMHVSTPIISHAILNYNKASKRKADGIIITSSHNPPEFGGIKYNIFTGGPANFFITNKIESKVNAILKNGIFKIKRISLIYAKQIGKIHEHDIIQKYILSLSNIVNMQLISSSQINLVIDPLGGSSLFCWQLIEEYYKCNIKIVNTKIDYTFYFLNLDYDGILRIDCASKSTLKHLSQFSNQADLGFANDPDGDRHAILNKTCLISPNHYLSIAMHYLLSYRSNWSQNVGVGKTYVSSVMMEKIAQHFNRKLINTPVGFKWFSNFLFEGSLGLCGEESSGATFLCFNGSPWSTDKDGIIMCLLAAEIVAKTEKTLIEYYSKLEKMFGYFYYDRYEFHFLNKKQYLKNNINIDNLQSCIITEDKIVFCIIISLEIFVKFKNGWIAIRPSGTENLYRVYCESFIDTVHLKKLKKSANKIIKLLFN
ncbi:phosphoglucomutase [Wigglesworthia glossinidia endosymbiont of Glossina morsitans morsitans (Yale colony)]|uniref:Phosphoglucomutase n=1 Tax=Wigglesworthia glossinidia endosymbiont of Glossina morsitans morsitans (Yale colony) TaxID=1142511 RepID=H6Q5X6_WIGGL|nr:alpha-D-glucose phosphate-specific phosphoglucomutase [Wigglesworthia glossinidia]AFA41172.1 phosphoglucomutase [Wigglesworthia glossinidia endosymbiont of Glossina morsitans morsitans (Yale colony)]